MKAINKAFSVLGLGLAMSMTSCVGDLDLTPNDPQTIVATNLTADQLAEVMAKCYSGIAVSGQGGPNGSSDISGLDGGTSQYTRALFMLNEFPTDESKWIWADVGVYDLNTNTFAANNANIYGTYSRLYVHIAICNDFLRLIKNGNVTIPEDMKATVEQFCLEARALRALSYYWSLDLFGNASFVDENVASGTKPVQYTRKQLYDWLVAELEDIVAKMPTAAPIYGRINRDAPEALLARLYLNAEVYTDGEESAFTKCAEHCSNIIARHQGGGWQGSGLANNYLYLFCGDNDAYMPGGSNAAENEILWGIPYDSEDIQPYGGTTFLCAAGISSTYTPSEDFGLSAQWGCMHATKEFADKFEEGDARWSMWAKESYGFSKENTKFSTYTDGYQIGKFSNLLKGSGATPKDWSNNGGGFAMDSKGKFWSAENGGSYGDGLARAEQFPDTDLPLIRLADVYLMYAECALNGSADQTTAVKYVNYLRSRANVSNWTVADLTEENILDERCRELYWELTRRTDLIRFDKFTGNAYNWSWKGNTNPGSSIPAFMKLYPIPTNVRAAQPEFKQNEGYN